MSQNSNPYQAPDSQGGEKAVKGTSEQVWRIRFVVSMWVCGFVGISCIPIYPADPAYWAAKGPVPMGIHFAWLGPFCCSVASMVTAIGLFPLATCRRQTWGDHEHMYGGGLARNFGCFVVAPLRHQPLILLETQSRVQPVVKARSSPAMLIYSEIGLEQSFRSSVSLSLSALDNPELRDEILSTSLFLLIQSRGTLVPLTDAREIFHL